MIIIGGRNVTLEDFRKVVLEGSEMNWMAINDKLSSFDQAIYHKLRAIVPKFIENEIKYPCVRKMKEYIQSNRIIIK